MDFNAVLINNGFCKTWQPNICIKRGTGKIGYIRSSFEFGLSVQIYGYQSALRKFRLDFDEKNVFTVTPNLNAPTMTCSRDSENEAAFHRLFADNDLMRSAP